MRLNTERKLLLLGGETNTLSVARSLGRLGVPVHVSAASKCVAGFSRFATGPHFLYSPAEEKEVLWKKLLVENPEPLLDGALILALNDAAISFTASYQAQLRKNYLLESNDPKLRERLLDKKETLRIAAESGLGVPKSWRVDSTTDVRDLASRVDYPILVKPIYSHLFQAVFGVKLFMVSSSDEAIDIIEKARNMLWT